MMLSLLVPVSNVGAASTTRMQMIPNQSATIADGGNIQRITFQDYNNNATGQYCLPPQPGNKYVALQVIVQNLGTQTIDVGYPWTFRGVDNFEYDISFHSCLGDTIAGAAITPGGQKSGFVAFEVPIAEQVQWIQYQPDFGSTVSLFLDYVLLTPTITSISPASGSSLVGTPVNIIGTNFARGANVTFGGVSGSLVTWKSSSSLFAYAPAHAVGAVDVTVDNGGGHLATAPGGFTYVGPTITGISPNHGPMGGGTAVALSGSLFQPGATVTFDGIAATNVMYVSANNMVATTPADPSVVVPGKPVNITVRNPDGTSVTSGGFMYQVRPGPEIPGAAPASMPQTRPSGAASQPAPAPGSSNGTAVQPAPAPAPVPRR